MDFCEQCWEKLPDKGALECPRCFAKQVGKALSARSDASRKKGHTDFGRSIGANAVSSDQQWAVSALDSLGMAFWGEDRATELRSVVEEKVAQDFPKPERRWVWHSVSIFFFVAALFSTALSDDHPTTMLLGAWLVSLNLHLFWAVHSYGRREKNQEEARERLKTLLHEEANKRLERESRLQEEWLIRQDEWRSSNSYLWEDDGGDDDPEPKPKPDPYPLGVSPDGAETLCAQWMEHLGQTNVRVTRSKSDGGIDVESDAWLAQVKHYRGSVGVTEVRELVGVTSIDGRTPVFFTSGQYTSGALEFADRAQVLLFSYNAERGTLKPENGHARRAIRQ